MNIPDKALEAAKDAYVAAIANKLIPSRLAAGIMLEAAAPLLLAQGWDEAIDYSSSTELEADEHKAENPYRDAE